MQPFDGGKFDKRYTDVYKPAITDAGLEPYRVDHDPAVSIPIDAIQAGIKNSAVCLADISLDNPNVWFELGFAIAYNKLMVMVCSEERVTKFPFDVQHRHIIKYRTESTSDFNNLKSQIADKLKSLIINEEKLQQIASNSPLAEVAGLSQYELMIMAIVAGETDLTDGSDGVISSLGIKQNMQKNGYTDIASNLGIRKLCRNDMLVTEDVADTFGNQYAGFRITSKGWDWIEDNEDKFAFFKSQSSRKSRPTTKNSDEDEIPF